MGKDLYDRYPCAAEIFHTCDAIRPGTLKQCFAGTEEQLKETATTQPCLFAVELATAAALAEEGVCPDAAAGFSLGEVAAATSAGIFNLETGFRLVCRRGELMQREARRFDTGMAAVIKLPSETVISLCEQMTDIYPVNFNCPGQIAVAGLSSQMPEFTAKVRQAGGRTVPLKVGGAFHSPFMEEAAKEFRKELENTPIQNATIPLYSNATGQPYTAETTDLLSRQISSPVRWETLIRNMIAAGVDTFIEIGPGKTLTNLIRKIDSDVNVCPAENYLK